MSSLAYLQPSDPPSTDSSNVTPRRIGDILLENGFITPSSLNKALALQSHSNAMLGEILLADKKITQFDLNQALSEQAALNYETDPYLDIDSTAQVPFEFDDMLRFQFAPTSMNDRSYRIAVSNPAMIRDIQTLCSNRDIKAQFVLSNAEKIHAQIARLGKSYFSKRSETSCPAVFSCRDSLRQTKTIPLLALVLICIGVLVFYGHLDTALLTLAAGAFLGNGVLKLACFMAYLFKPAPTKPAVLRHQKLERVSILVPIYKETDIVERLISRLSQLDYPKELMEICIICEEEDRETIAALEQVTLPRQFRVLIAPRGTIQTKPRAMNYALNFCSGSIIGVYDAEDAPEYDQVYKAVRHLQQAKENVVCVQARLDFFNQDTNWLARCFTIEYAILFRVMLQGLQKLDLPIPLGGTSMFIRRQALDRWGGWDAHNVTEDADLGMRLYRQGLRVECLDSTTYEEANYKLQSWIKQRSRWLKGFMVTWLTHMRTPVAGLRDMGVLGFLTFNALMLGTILTYLLIPLVLPYWLFSFGVQPDLLGQIPTVVLPVMVVILALGEPLLFLIGRHATNSAKHKPIRTTLFSMFAYWPLASVAAYKALYEVVFAPSYWDKTQHGLNDHIFEAEINNLTLPKWRKQN